MCKVNHSMRLFPEPFELIKSTKKVIEIRLNDEKRQKVKIGDTITFTRVGSTDTLMVKVIGLLYYSSFEQLYRDIPFTLFGREDKSLEWMLKGTYQIYTKEQEIKYGVLGIRIELI